MKGNRSLIRHFATSKGDSFIFTVITRVSKQEQSGSERSHQAYRRNDDDQELLSLELFHGAHLNVRQAHLPEKDPNLLTLKRNQVVTGWGGWGG